MSPISWIGLVAATLTTIAFIPQSVRTVRTRDTSGLSPAMYTIFLIGVLSWLIYGVLVGDLAIMVANMATVVFAFPVLAVMILNRAREQSDER